MSLFAGLFTAPSWQTFTVLAYGWAVASGERQTITTYLWLTGATTVKHFSCFYAFLGGALYQARWQLWARIIRCAAQWVPAEAPIVIDRRRLDQEKGGAADRRGRPLPQRRGLGPPRISHAARAQLCVGDHARPVPGWPGQSVSVPIGLSLYLKEEQARKLKLPYQSRSALAREIVDFVAAQLPPRRIRVLGDGGYATKEYVHQLPATVNVVGRMLITGKLYAPAASAGLPRAGAVPRRKARCWGPRKPWPANGAGWQPHIR